MTGADQPISTPTQIAVEAVDPPLRGPPSCSGRTWMMAALVLYSLHTLNAPPAGYGVLLTSYATGALLGAATCTRVHQRLGARTTVTTAALAPPNNASRCRR